MSRIIDVTLNLKDNFTDKMKKAESSFIQNGKIMTQNGRQIAAMGRRITNLGAGLTKGITVPVAAMGVASVKNFGDVDKQMRLVQQTMGSTEKEAERLERQMKKAASNSVFSMKDAADATLNFARQGFKASEAGNMLAPALNLAAATSTDLSVTTSGLGNTMKAFGAKSKEASHYTDMFAKAQAQANTTTTELFDAMGIAGSTAKTVGWGFSDIATITGIFGDHSISAAKGATALNTGLMRIASPASDGAKAMDKLGINVFKANGKLKSMPSVMKILNKSFQGLSDKEKLAAASSIFGKNQASKWIALIDESPSKFKKMSNAIDGTKGTSKKMADALLNGVGGSIEKLKSTFDVFKYNVGEIAGKHIKGLVDGVTKLIDKFNGLSDAQKSSVVKFVAIAAAVGPALLVFGKVTTAVGSTMMTLGKLAKAAKKVHGVLGLIGMPGGKVILICIGIAAAALLIVKNWDKVKAAAQKVFGFVKKTFSGVNGESKGLTKAVGKVGKHFLQLASKAKKLWAIVGPVFKKIGALAASIFVAKWKFVFSTGMGILTGIGKSIMDWVDGVVKAFTGIIDFLTGVFTGNWKKAWTGVKEIFGGIFQSLASLVKAPLNAVIGCINGAITGINNIGIKIPNWVPKLGGKSFSVNVPKIPYLARGTQNWGGGMAIMNEKGGELVDLPRGSRVYPHDQSVKRAYNDGRRAGGGFSFKFEKLADQVVFKSEQDMDVFIEKLANKLESIANNMGGEDIGYTY